VQGKLLKLLAKKVEFCYAPPSISPLYVSKTAAYSTGMQPGSASWNFFKTAQLAAPFTNNIASLFRGDTAVSGQKQRSRQMASAAGVLVCLREGRWASACFRDHTVAMRSWGHSTVCNLPKELTLQYATYRL
jgi:hypothetical protein